MYLVLENVIKLLDDLRNETINKKEIIEKVIFSSRGIRNENIKKLAEYNKEYSDLITIIDVLYCGNKPLKDINTINKTPFIIDIVKYIITNDDLNLYISSSIRYIGEFPLLYYFLGKDIMIEVIKETIDKPDSEVKKYGLLYNLITRLSYVREDNLNEIRDIVDGHLQVYSDKINKNDIVSLELRLKENKKTFFKELYNSDLVKIKIIIDILTDEGYNNELLDRLSLIYMEEII